MSKTTTRIPLSLLFIAWTAFTAAIIGYETGTLKATEVKLELNEAQLRADLAETNKKTTMLLIQVQKKHNAKLKGLLNETIKIAETMTRGAQACNDLLKEQDKKEGLKAPN